MTTQRTGFDFEEARPLVVRALHEDIGDGDHSALACIPATSSGTAIVVAKEPGVVVGLELARLIFKEVDPGIAVDTLVEEGAVVDKGTKVLRATWQRCRVHLMRNATAHAGTRPPSPA